MKKKIITCLVSIYIVISCAKESKNIYYTNGNIKMKFESNYNEKYTKVLEFDENGQIKVTGFINNIGQKDSLLLFFQNDKLFQTITYDNGKVNGPIIWFYPDSSIKEKAILKDSLRTGPHTFYRKDGSIQKIIYFKILNDKSVVNNQLFFDEKGDTLKELSSYFEIISTKDTISINEFFNFKIKYIGPEGSLMRGFIADFDSNFNLRDTNSINMILFDSINNVRPPKAGINFIRIRMQRKLLKNDSHGNAKEYIATHFLEEEYFVE